MTKLEILRDWVDSVWSRGELHRIPDFFCDAPAADGILTDLSLGPQDFIELVTALRMRMQDIRFEFAHHMEVGDWLWALCTVHAINAATGTPIAFTGQLALRFSGSRFAQAINHFDMISMFQQLGNLPPDTFPLCLMGEKLS